MRPTDEEIEKQAFKWDHSIQDKEDFELGAKWARDFDPWYYTEDGDLPKLTVEGRDLSEKFSDFLFIIPKGRAYHNALTAFYVKDDLENRIFFEGMKNRFDIDQVECWMHIPTPKK